MIKCNNRVGKKRAKSSISSISLVLSAIVFIAVLVFKSTTVTAVTGIIDTSFDPGAGLNATTYSIVPQPDGKILIGGAFTTYNGVARNRHCSYQR